MRAVPCRLEPSVGPVFRRSRMVWRHRMAVPRRGPLPSLARIRTPVCRPGTRTLQRRLQNQTCNRYHHIKVEPGRYLRIRFRR